MRKAHRGRGRNEDSHPQPILPAVIDSDHNAVVAVDFGDRLAHNRIVWIKAEQGVIQPTAVTDR